MVRRWCCPRRHAHGMGIYPSRMTHWFGYPNHTYHMPEHMPEKKFLRQFQAVPANCKERVTSGKTTVVKFAECYQ
jgi:hypothetical protein